MSDSIKIISNFAVGFGNIDLQAATKRGIVVTNTPEVLNDATVEYCKTRKQFGQPIGKFQVLQHRMVDMFMQYEQSVSMTYMVNLKLDEDYAERRKAASGAKVQIAKAAKFIGQSAVQLHGGMGMTDELNVGHYFKRLSMIENSYGNIDHHLKKYSSAE